MARDLIKDNPHPSAPSNGTAAELNRVRADLVDLRTKFIAVLAKLDADGGVTDANYAALQTPAALTSEAITINGAAPV